MMYHNKTRVHFIIPLIIVGIVVGVLISGRDFDSDWLKFDFSENEGQGGMSWLPTFITFCTVLISIDAIHAIFKNGSGDLFDGGGIAENGLKYNALYYRKSTTRLDKNALLIAFVAYFIASNVISGIFGAIPAFNYQMLYSLVLFSSLYFSRNESLSIFVETAKLALFGMLGLSLLLAVFLPSIALQRDYGESLIGVDFRLWGLASHPNSLGPLALTLLMLEYFQPCHKIWMRKVSTVVALGAFIFAQSKTTWLAGVVIYFILDFYKLKNAGPAHGKYFSRVAALVLMFGLAFFYMSNGEGLSNFLIDDELSTLSGRDQIWLMAIDIWKTSPIVGYGPTLWDFDFRRSIGMPFAFHAHNQILQSLSSAGILGGLALGAYVLVLGIYCIRAANSTNGVSIALYVLILFRSVSESPLSVIGIMNGDFLMHLLVFRFALFNGVDTRNIQYKQTGSILVK